MKFVKDWWYSQWVSHNNVTPTCGWSDKDRAFFLNSKAGIIKFKPKTSIELVKFRNTYINRFDSLVQDALKGEDITSELFKLYKEIRKNYRVSYTANFHTRLKGKGVCFLAKFI